MRQLIIDAVGLIAPDIAPHYRIQLALFCLAWLVVVVVIAAWFMHQA